MQGMDELVRTIEVDDVVVVDDRGATAVVVDDGDLPDWSGHAALLVARRKPCHPLGHLSGRAEQVVDLERVHSDGRRSEEPVRRPAVGEPIEREEGMRETPAER